MPRIPDRTSKGVSTLSVDFTGVEDRRGGSSAHVPAGDYVLELVKATVVPNRDDDGKHVNWQFKIIKGGGRGTIYHNTTLKPDKLWALRNILQDLLDKEIPKRALNIDFDKYVGKQLGATLEDDDPYTNPTTGKTTIKSKIAYTFPAREYNEETEASDDSEEAEAGPQTADIDTDEDEELEEIDTEDL